MTVTDTNVEAPKSGDKVLPSRFVRFGLKFIKGLRRRTTAPAKPVPELQTFRSEYNALEGALNSAEIDKVYLKQIDKVMVEATQTANTNDGTNLKLVMKGLDLLAHGRGLLKAAEIASKTASSAERSEERLKIADAKSKDLGKAIKAQKDKMSALKDEAKALETAKPGSSLYQEYKELLADYKAIKAHVGDLEARKGQYDALLLKDDDGKTASDRALVAEESLSSDAAGLADTLTTGSPKMTELLTALLAPMGTKNYVLNENDQKARAKEAIKNRGKITEKIADLKAQIATASTTIVRMDRVSPDEPQITEISAKQAASLTGMLDKAERLLPTDKVLEAEAIWLKADTLFRGMKGARAVALPPVQKPTDRAKELKGLLGEIQAGIYDLEALGNDQAATHQTALDALKGEYTAAVDAVGDDKMQAVDPKIVALLKTVKDAVATKVEVSKQTELLAQKAEETGKKVNKILADIYRTKDVTAPVTYRDPVTDEEKTISRIEDPLYTYSKVELEAIELAGGLVKTEDVLTVEGPDGKDRILEIQHRDDSLGGDLTRRGEKGVPRELLDMMKHRADTLKMLAEDPADGTAEMMMVYTAEMEAWTRVLEDNKKKSTSAFVDLEKRIDKIKRILGELPLSTYKPIALATFETEWKTFLSEWQTALPLDTDKQLKIYEVQVTELKKRADTIKEQHETLTKTVDTHISDVRKALDTAGKEIKNFCKLMQSYEQDQAPGMAQYLSKLKEAGKIEGFNTENEKKLKSVKMQLENTGEGAITTAQKNYDAIKEGLTQELKNARALAIALKGDAIVAKKAWEKLKGGFIAAADKSVDLAKKKTEYDKLKAAMDAEIKQANKDLKDNGDRLPDIGEAKSKVSALESNVKAIDGQGKATGDYDDALTRLKELDADRQEVKRITALASGKLKDVTPFKQVNVAGRVDLLTQGFTKLAEAARKVKPTIEGKADGEAVVQPENENDAPTVVLEKVKYAKQIEAVDAIMGMVAAIGAPNDIKEKAKEVDSLAGTQPKDVDKTKRDEAKKVRGEILALIRSLEGRLEGHPALEVYRDNPFDSGNAFILLRSAIHNLRKGVLESIPG
ncbi:MAG: hypothetical protein AAFR17_01630 [Pseudomonadota bacterium]